MAKILTGGLPGGAVAGRGEVMAVLEQTGDSHHDRFQRVSHGGTFNANPYCAATGVAALRIASTGEMQETADRMADRLRVGSPGNRRPVRGSSLRLRGSFYFPRLFRRPFH